MTHSSSFSIRVVAALLAGGLLAPAVTAAETAPAWFYRAWQTDEGLPANSVTGAAQTPDGRLWVATHSGLATFDGIRFRTIALPIPAGRLNPLIRCLTQDRANRIWLALEGGIVICVEPSANSTRVFTSSDGLALFRPCSIVADKNGAVWISYSDGSVCRIAEGKVTRLTARDGLAGVGLCNLASDNGGNIWFIKAGQCGVFEESVAKPLFAAPAGVAKLAMAHAGGIWICGNGRLLRAKSSTNPPVDLGKIPVTASGIEPTALLEDRSGAVWIGTTGGGLFRFEDNLFQSISTSQTDILDLAEDREGNIWAGTDGGGLNRVRQRTLELQASDQGLPGPSLRSICEDGMGTMWAVAQNGELIRHVNQRWQKVAGSQGRPETRAMCVSSDGQKGVWVGTYHAGLQHWDGSHWTVLGRNDGLGGEVVRGLLLDSRGDLWLAIEGNTCVQRLRQGKFQTFEQPANSRPVRALAEDTRGNVWFGTLSGLLLRAEGDQLINETALSLPSRNPIRCLLPTDDGSLWIGYAGAGLGRIKDKSFAHVGEKEGLPDTYINAIASDHGGSFWFATDRGIFQVRRKELEAVADGLAAQVRAVVYGRDEALQNLQANYGYAPGSARSRDGRIWFPMRTGLAVIHPDRVVPRRMPPTVTVEATLVDGHAMKLKAGEPLRLQPQHRRIDIEYTAFSFIAPESMEFRHRLEGWEDDWTGGGTERHASYSRLPAGQYTFRVTARPRVGEWTANDASLVFVVEPFLWQRWWFRVAALLAFTCAVIGVVRYVSFRRLRLKVASLEQETALQRDRARIAHDLHDDLGANLTQIALLSELAQHDFAVPEKARGHIDHIFKTARALTRSLDEIVWAVNPKNDSLDRYVAHLCTYAPEYLRSAGVRCRLDVPADVPPIVLPADVRHHLHLAVKEALHNVAKHAGAQVVRLQLSLEARGVRVMITDDGRGIDDAAKGDRDGLRNLAGRMSEIGGRFERQSAPGHGTTLLFTVPLHGAGGTSAKK